VCTRVYRAHPAAAKQPIKEILVSDQARARARWDEPRMALLRAGSEGSNEGGSIAQNTAWSI
jgi:hypothetical protein